MTRSILGGACRLAVLFALSLAAVAIAQQRYVLDSGDPANRSSAVVTGGQLTVVDAQGNRFDYDRRRLRDSLDGRYLAYYSDVARQFIRFPASGAGSMYIGTPRGAMISWRRSQMTVQPVAAAGGTTTVVPTAPVLGIAPAAPLNFGLLAGPDGRYTLASVDEAGLLHYYAWEQNAWRHGESTVRDALPPGAPLTLTMYDAGRAAAYGVNSRGEVVEIADGHARTISSPSAPRFTPGAHLANWSDSNAEYLCAVDDSGRLWQIEPSSDRFTPVESRGGYFEPGEPIVAVADAAGAELFLVDRSGNLIGYALRGGGWSRPYRVAAGFLSGGALSGDYAMAEPGHSLYLAAVDAAGRLRVLRRTGTAWSEQSVGSQRLPPGAPVSLIAAADGVHLSAVQSDGQWYEWYQAGDRWSSRVIAAGFPPGAPVLLHPAGPQAFAVDRTGRLVAGRWRDGGWRSSLLSPDHQLAPLLERRNIVPNPPLAPVDVVFENPHDEALVARIFDSRRPDRPIELTIPAGGRVTQRLDRDAGATLEEVNLLAAPGGQLVEDVQRYPLPPQQLYNVVVYANRVTSVYFDRTTNDTDIPDEENRTLVSLGVFPIPPGELVRAGEQIDVYREARRAHNPGAVSRFDTPGQPPE